MAEAGGEHSAVSTAVLWVGGFCVIALAIAAYSFDGRDGLQGLLSASDLFGWGFNALDLLLVPLQAGLLLISALSMWAASRWISTPSLRAVLIAAELASAVFVLVTVIGFEALQIVFSPVPVLMFLIPLAATAIYAAIAQRRAVMRVLGVTWFTFAGGVMLYVLGVILFGSQG
jgi:hypothetical protein